MTVPIRNHNPKYFAFLTGVRESHADHVPTTTLDSPFCSFALSNRHFSRLLLSFIRGPLAMTASLLPRLTRSPLRVKALVAIDQPLTTHQVARRLRVSLEACRQALRFLRRTRLVECLNPAATRSRVQWLTTLGRRVQAGLPGSPRSVFRPDVDYALYGWLCFSHRPRWCARSTVRSNRVRFAFVPDPELTVSA